MLNMQVKSMPETLDECLADMANIDVGDLYCSADPLLSDDIWKKFEFDFPLSDLSTFDDIFKDLDCAMPEMFCDSEIKKLCEFRGHDCMWAGHCGSKEHPTNERKTFKIFNNNKLQAPAAIVAPGPEKTPVIKQQPVAAGRSLLLKTVMPKASPVPVLPSPDSPPISDDEDPKGQTSTLKMLNDAINECDIDEDSDLCEYFGEGGDLVPEPDDPPPPPKQYFTPANDHSYHKDKNASMRMANLGIETPSDSEEEIDVVSVGEKNRIGYGLPTNPSSQYQQHLERTVQSAITKKRTPNRNINRGIKTIPPVRKSSISEQSSLKKRVPESRGVKRRHHYNNRTSSNYQPYKRRAIHVGSDSEPELEKRSLHNNMERQRRVDLRNAFEDLRKLVPKLSMIDRAAKVAILQDSSKYCIYLTDANDGLQRKVQDLRKKQERLRARVSQLRRSLAAKR